MTERRAEIGMADALVAASALGLPSAALGPLAELLGMVQPVRRAVQENDDGPQPGADQPLARLPGAGRDDSATPPPRASDPVGRFPTVVRELPSDGGSLGADPRLSPVLAAAAAGAPQVGYEPPVPARQLPAAIAGLLRRTRLSGRPDVPALVAALATGRPLRHVPPETEQSLSHGAVVVADVGPGMAPFLEDVTHLVSRVQQVVGYPNVEVLWSFDAQQPAPIDRPGPVLVISALGWAHAPMAAPGSARRWRELLWNLVDTGHDVVALVPHRQLATRSRGQRLPMHVVAWDELATVGRGRV